MIIDMSTLDKNKQIYRTRLNVNKFYENLLFAAFLGLIFLVSLLLNTASLYSFFKLKRKIVADHIKAHIFIINLLFTFIAIPYYILKETEIIDGGFACKFSYFITDFIMFVYNNLLILMAIDRFIYICTRLRYKLKSLMMIFYLVTFLIALTSIARLLSDDCSNTGFSMHSNYSDPNPLSETDLNTKNWRETILHIYNYFILFVISINCMGTFLFYGFIVRFVYVNSFKSYKQNAHFELKASPAEKNEKEVLVPAVTGPDNIDNNKKSEQIQNENLSIENKPTSNSSQQEKQTFFEIKKNFKTKKVLKSNFKKSKHWKITKTFIKVN